LKTEREQGLPILAPPLHHQENCQHQDAGSDDLWDRDPPAHGSPLIALPLDQPEDDAEQAGGGEHNADPIEPMTPAGTQVRHEKEREHERDEPDRQVHIEDPPPAEMGHDEAAQHRTE